MGPTLDYPALYCGSVCVYVRNWHGAAVFGQRGPLCVHSTPEQKPRSSGLRFKSNKLLRCFRDDIWRYQCGGAARGFVLTAGATANL